MKTTTKDVKDFFTRPNLKRLANAIADEQVGLKNAKDFLKMIRFLQSNEDLEELLMHYFALQSITEVRKVFEYDNPVLHTWAHGFVMGVMFREHLEEKELEAKLFEMYNEVDKRAEEK